MLEVTNYLSFKNAVESIIKLIQERATTRNVCYLAPQFDFSKNTWQLEIKSKIVCPSITEFREECEKLEPVKKCLDLMLERNFPEYLEMRIVDSSGKPVENPDYRSFLMAEILGTLVNKYLEIYGFEFREEEFKKLYDEMVEYVYSKGRELVIVSPLENFELRDTTECSIGKYKIRELSEWEMQELIKHGYPLGFIFGPDFGSIETRYCAETIINVPRRHTPSLEPYIEDFVTVLRLFKHENVEHGCILHYPKIWRTSWGMSFGYRSRLHVFPKYILSKDDIPSLNSFAQRFFDVKNQLPNSVKFAMRWFNKSYREYDTLDRLLDLAIALEVLFSTSDRLDLYIPHFIGSNKEEKIKLNKDIKELRDKRGSIVHSGYSKVEQGFVENIKNIFRLCMLKFIDLLPNTTYKEILEDIRNRIIAGS